MNPAPWQGPGEPHPGEPHPSEPLSGGPGPADLFPGADDVTAEAVVTVVQRPVAGLSRRIAGAYAATAATGRILYIVTSAQTCITYPLELLLTASPAVQWIVPSPASPHCRDGMTGQPLHWDGNRYSTGTDPGPTSHGPRHGPSHDPSGPATAPPAPPPQLAGPGSLRVDITRLQPAAETTDISETASAAATALTGTPPTGWGTGEPATEPWSPAELTAFARQRAPQPTSVVITAGTQAHPATGLLEAEPATVGVLIHLCLAVGTGNYPSHHLSAALDELAGTLAAQQARAMLVSWQPGHASTTRPPGPQPVVPVALLAGHDIVAARGHQHASKAPAQTTTIIGTPASSACWCRFGTTAPRQELADVTNHFQKW